MRCFLFLGLRDLNLFRFAQLAALRNRTGDVDQPSRQELLDTPTDQIRVAQEFRPPQALRVALQLLNSGQRYPQRSRRVDRFNIDP